MHPLQSGTQTPLYPELRARPPARPQPSRPTAGNRVRTKKTFARVTAGYPADNAGELNLFVGDVIEVTGKHDEYWLIGILGGRKGMFPRSFVIIEEEGVHCKADTDAKAEGLSY